ncbi:alcohol dehydrogenase catalytic domain-containing protein [Myceligenerans crystallogenes]|uniref:Zinc-binding dehydrogenase n=1 Tax=Myceligenerans crystallogenes TaxID=316335 RepID=A0ABN2N9G9_9MICO
MEAILLHAFGPPENLVVGHLPDPAPGPGQVLVDAVAHGVHLMDTSLRRGVAGPLALPELPAVPGREVAGVVSRTGAGVPASWTGTRVAAHLGAVARGGGYARRVVVDAAALHRIPDGPRGPLGEADAIAMIGTGRMAVYTLDVAGLTPADVVVVTAAAGGLGSLFVQEALAVGARVLALAGGEAKLRVLRELTGGTHGAPGDTGPSWLVPDRGRRIAWVDYTAPGWVAAAREALAGLTGDDAADGGSATVVFDGVGGELGTAATALLRTGGRLIAYGWASGAPNGYTSWAAGSPEAGGGLGRGPAPDDVVVRYAVGPDAPPMGDQRPYQERALAAAASGRWRVLTHRVPFAEAARAHRELEERRTTGKVVLV